jgi:hypothetical protein
MGRVTTEVRGLRQDRRKAEPDAHRRDGRFAVGDEALLDGEQAPPPSRSLLSPRWMGPFKVLACPAPNTYRLDVASRDVGQPLERLTNCKVCRIYFHHSGRF